MKYQYQCIGKFGMFKFFNRKGCGEKFDVDFDTCPICRGYLIPESMVTDVHKNNMVKTNEK